MSQMHVYIRICRLLLWMSKMFKVDRVFSTASELLRSLKLQNFLDIFSKCYTCLKIVFKEEFLIKVTDLTKF